MTTKMFKTAIEAIEAGFKPEDYRPACLEETIGQYKKPLLWVAGKPYVKKQIN